MSKKILFGVGALVIIAMGIFVIFGFGKAEDVTASAPPAGLQEVLSQLAAAQQESAAVVNSPASNSEAASAPIETVKQVLPGGNPNGSDPNAGGGGPSSSAIGGNPDGSDPNAGGGAPGSSLGGNPDGSDPNAGGGAP